MLPSAWTYKPISAFKHATDQTVQTGPFGAQLHSDDYVDEGVPFILIRNMIRGGVDASDMPRITQEDAERLSSYRLKLNDIVFSRVGRVGSCFLTGLEQVGWVLWGQLLRLRLDLTSLNPNFLVHWIRSPYVERHIGNESVGSTRQSINSAILGNMPVPAIPLPEQVKIAQILDTLDTAIRHTEAIIAKLKAVKQGLLRDLLTRGIDTNGELRPPQSEAPHLYKQSSLGWIPKEWDAAELNDLIDARRPIVYGILMPGYGYSGGVPVVKVKDIVNDRISLSDLLLTSPQIDREYARSRLQAGDLLFTIRGTVGRTAFVPKELDAANITQDTARLAVSGIDSRFVRAYLSTPVAARFVAVNTLGVAVQGINLRDVRRIPMARPLLSEATEIADRIEAVTARVESEGLNLGKLRLAKSGLLDDLLTGRIRVTPLLEQAAH